RAIIRLCFSAYRMAASAETNSFHCRFKKDAIISRLFYCSFVEVY
ncbi:peptidase, M23 family, partial [Vibrio parahaemolyticus VPTS-2010]